MSAIESTGISSKVEEQYESMKSLLEGFFLPSSLAKNKKNDIEKWRKKREKRRYK